MPISTPRLFARARVRSTVAAAAVLALAALPLALSPAASAAPDPAYSCPTSFPNLGSGSHPGYDARPNIYVGGELKIQAPATEGEGLILVGGDASFDINGRYNLGVAGVGSRVPPPPGSDMLVVGGNVTVSSGTILDVGHAIGGNIVAGGAVTAAPGAIELSGGTSTTSVANPLAGYADWPANFQGLSQQFAALPTTAGASVTEEWGTLTFTGDGSAARQVFALDSAMMAALATKAVTLNFAKIPLGTVIVINVSGAAATITTQSTMIDEKLVNPTATGDNIFSTLTQSIMWNFVDATEVTMLGGNQLPGSIMVPTAGSHTAIKTHTNGRVYVAGDLTQGGAGAPSGQEFHAYPFNDVLFNCKDSTQPEPETGSLTVQKLLVDSFGVVDPTRVYAGTYVCRDAALVVVAQGVWSRTAGAAAAAIGGIPLGSSCVVAEDALAPPAAGEASYFWGSPVVSPSGAVIVADATIPVAVTVTNTVLRAPVAPASGDFGVRKLLNDVYGVVLPDRIYTGTFSCLSQGVDVTPAPGTWSALADGVVVPLASGLPVGAVCSVTEHALTVDPLPGDPHYLWDAPQYSASSVTIVAAQQGVLTVTNTVLDPRPGTPGPGGGGSHVELPTMPITGATPLPLMLMAGGLFLLGMVLAVTAWRGRRA